MTRGTLCPRHVPPQWNSDVSTADRPSGDTPDIARQRPLPAMGARKAPSGGEDEEHDVASRLRVQLWRDVVELVAFGTAVSQVAGATHDPGGRLCVHGTMDMVG